jgi:hypothetical protein
MIAGYVRELISRGVDPASAAEFVAKIYTLGVNSTINRMTTYPPGPASAELPDRPKIHYKGGWALCIDRRIVEFWQKAVQQAAGKAGVSFYEMQRRLLDGESELEITLIFDPEKLKSSVNWVEKAVSQNRLALIFSESE